MNLDHWSQCDHSFLYLLYNTGRVLYKVSFMTWIWNHVMGNLSPPSKSIWWSPKLWYLHWETDLHHGDPLSVIIWSMPISQWVMSRGEMEVKAEMGWQRAAGTHQERTLPASQEGRTQPWGPWSWTSSLQTYKRIFCCYGSQWYLLTIVLI